MVKESQRLARVAKIAVEGGDGKRARAYRVAFGRYQQACRRYGQLQQEVPVPTRFYLLGVLPFGKVYGVPGWAKAKALLPWWARWAVAARRVTPKKASEGRPRRRLRPREPAADLGASGRRVVIYDQDDRPLVYVAAPGARLRPLSGQPNPCARPDGHDWQEHYRTFGPAPGTGMEIVATFKACSRCGTEQEGSKVWRQRTAADPEWRLMPPPTAPSG